MNDKVVGEIRGVSIDIELRHLDNSKASFLCTALPLEFEEPPSKRAIPTLAILYMLITKSTTEDNNNVLTK